MFKKGLLFPPGALAPPRIDEFAVGRSRDPGCRIVGHPAFRPMTQRRRKCLLHRLLGAIEGAAQPDQPGDDPAVLAAKYRLRGSDSFSRLRHHDLAWAIARK